MKWSREDYISHMTFENSDRQMFVEMFGLLVGLDNEWRAQGATDDEIALTAFDFDYVPIVGCGSNLGPMDAFTPYVIEETDKHVISKDYLGRTVKLCKGVATIALPLDYPVHDMDSWLKVKHMFTFREDRIDWDFLEFAKGEQKKGALVTAPIYGGFDFPRELMGEENLCIAYYEDRELIEDMMETITDSAFRVLDRISDKIVIDNIAVHEDMAGKSGPLIGPNLINDYIKPYYRKIWDMLSSKGTKLFTQDSDGNMIPVIDAMLDCGVNVMYPAEPAAGMDIVELRKKYGKRVAFMGGIDKFVLQKSKNDILRELEYKMQPMMHMGGCAFGIDHRIPNSTPLENYRFYVDTAREILGIPKRNGNLSWGRMAL